MVPVRTPSAILLRFGASAAAMKPRTKVNTPSTTVASSWLQPPTGRPSPKTRRRPKRPPAAAPSEVSRLTTKLARYSSWALTLAALKIETSRA
jgi:hypothetical protein